MAAITPTSSSADSGPLLRSVGMRGGACSTPAAPTHSHSVPAARLQALRQVVGPRRLQPLRVEEIKLSNSSVFHVPNVTSETRRDAPQFRV